MATSDLSRYIIPNLSQDPAIALQGAQAAQFQSSPMFQGTIERQAFASEYQVPTAVRFGTNMVISTPSNTIGLPNPVGNSTGPSSGAPINISTGVTSIIPGSGISVSQPTGNVTISSTGGGGTPAPPTTSVQFNNAGAFGGDTNFTYDPGTVTLTVPLVHVSSSLDVDGNTNLDGGLDVGGNATVAGNINGSANADITGAVKTDVLGPHTTPGAFGSFTLALQSWAILNPFAFWFFKSTSRVIWPFLAGGDATSGNTKGGSVGLVSGVGSGTGKGGDVYLTAGDGSSTSGSVIIGDTSGDFGSRIPSTSSDTGTKGAIAIDANFIYVCTATNTWKQAALSSF